MIKAKKDFEFRGNVYEKGDPVEGYASYLQRHLLKQGLVSEAAFEIPKKIIKAGYDTEAKVNGATDEELLKIKGVGEKTLLDTRNGLANR